MNTVGRVSEKVAFVTGAGRGQGRSHALRLAEEGADIIAVDICDDYSTVSYSMSSRHDLLETKALVESVGRRIVVHTADVRNGPELCRILDDGVAVLGRLDIVCANAGISTVQTWDEVTEDLWRDTIDTNLHGVWNTFAAAAPHLIAAGGGSMIAIGSTGGRKGLPFFAPYVAAKHGVVGIVRSLANELARHSIRVNVVHPTSVDTAIVAALSKPVRDALERDPNLGALFMNSLPGVSNIEVEDVSNAVLFLASDESRYVTGLELFVDAGNTAR
jgi:SDR family mycofactocin-dependent oxidoreductase